MADASPCPHCWTMLKPLPKWTGVEGVLCPGCGGDIRHPPTARHAILKHGELILAGYRRWARSQACQHCRRSGPSDPHHYPTRGHSGVVFDLRICSLCGRCHRRAEGSNVIADGRRLAPIAPELQDLYVYESWLLFVERAPVGDVAEAMAEIVAWRARRGEAVPL